jgi:site-specific DNA-methyltransferase (adenine-specific)
MTETRVLEGDCARVLKTFPNATFDLIVTSPPYADKRKHTYGGVRPGEYVEWFLERSAEFYRVLKPRGSFVLNIKEKVENGERHTFVLELILALRKQGWLWTEEYIWHKKNCYPGKWPNRFRDAWERCLHFTKEKKFKMNQEAVMVPMGDWAETRLRALGKNDVVRYDSQVQSGFGKNIANWVERTMAFPTNVLHLPTECGNKSHSAAFPKALPEWFIKLFSDEGDWVLDPFLGSGTTLEAAKNLARNSVGIDISPEYCEMTRATVVGTQMELLEERGKYEIDKQTGADYLHRKQHSELPSKAPGRPRRAKAEESALAEEPVSLQGKER